MNSEISPCVEESTVWPADDDPAPPAMNNDIFAFLIITFTLGVGVWVGGSAEGSGFQYSVTLPPAIMHSPDEHSATTLKYQSPVLMLWCVLPCVYLCFTLHESPELDKQIKHKAD